LKPKNKKQFNWSYFRFYLMWLLTSLLALVPLVVLFSGLLKCEDCKRIETNNKINTGKNINYNDVKASLDSLKTIIKIININDPGKLHLEGIRNYKDNFIMEDQADLSKKLRDIATQVLGLANKYESKLTNETKDITRTTAAKDKEILELTGDLNDAKNALKSCQRALQN